MTATESILDSTAITSECDSFLAELEQQFGDSFSLWRRQGSQFTASDDWGNDDRECVNFVALAHEGTRPQAYREGDSVVLAVPLREMGREDAVAVGRIAGTEPHLAIRHADLWVENARLQNEVGSLTEQTEALVVQVSQDFEELSLLRTLAEHAGLQSDSTDAADVAATILPELRAVLDAEGVALVLPHDDEQIESDSVTNVMWSGGAVLDDSKCVQLVNQFRDEAADRPVVRNLASLAKMRADFSELREFVLVQIKTKGRLYGWLLACNCASTSTGDEYFTPRGYDGFTSIEGALLVTAASMLGGNFHNVDLLRQKDQLFTSVVQSLVNAVEAKDPYTCGHSQRVAALARCLGKQIGLAKPECQRLHLSGLLHDVGKIAVDDTLLRKKGKLTDDEFEKLRDHPEAGWAILHELEQLRDVLPGVLYHHEWFDGTGYPDQLAGEEIPLDGRIMAICDAYDAMTSDRPYRQGMPQEKAEAILRDGAGTQWDPRLIDTFIEAMPSMVEIREEYHPRDQAQRKPKSI